MSSGRNVFGSHGAAVAKSSAGHLMHKLKHKRDSFSPPAFSTSLSLPYSDLAVRVSAQNAARQKGPREDREDRVEEMSNGG